MFSNHYYQIAPAQAIFADAISQASQMSFNGQLGYLAAVSSRAEFDFIDKVLGARNVWLAATDILLEGMWLTAAGPNISAPVPPDVWAFGEPFGGQGENCAYSMTAGLSDSDCNQARFYVIEYECQTVGSAPCECMISALSLHCI
jgi:hypothetical protein